MDEQIKAEKKAEKEKKRRRLILLRKIKVGGALCCSLALILYLLCAFVFFKIDTVEVVGVKDTNGNILPASSYYTHDEIIRVSGVETGDSLVRVSKREVEDVIETLLPYVGDVKVKKRYPSTLRLVTEDTHALYGADAGGGFTLLDKDFKVLNVSERLPLGSMKLVGVSFDSAETGATAVFVDEAFKNRINTVISACENAGITNITKLDLSNIANVRIVLDNRITFVLGTITDLPEKLSLGLKTMEAEYKDSAEAKIIIDVTDTERSYVRDDYSPVEDEYETELIEPETDYEPVPEEIPEEQPEEVPAEPENNQAEAVG
ncbi:MAG: FtsQ-type POTRA domain-containing protein [Clostridia bacterium]|nr:FtsQ-type POTRA domain-containing protein [Clostridia bacterium]